MLSATAILAIGNEIERASPECSLATVPTRVDTPAPMVAPNPDQKKVQILSL